MDGTDNCIAESDSLVQCQCKANIDGEKCDTCSVGTIGNFPNCQPGNYIISNPTFLANFVVEYI